MKLVRRFPLRLRSERGFSLLEVVAAMGLTIGVVLATISAVANSLHGSAVADLHMLLNDDALNVLTDVRAISAYDKAMLASLNGRTITMNRKTSNGTAEAISVSIKLSGSTPSIASAATGSSAAAPVLVATATVTEGEVTVTQTQTLSWEAPEPGSSVDQP